MKAPKKILVVDDEKTILLSLAYALKAEGVDVITCNRGEWAEKALENYFFDIVITDLRLSKTADAEGMQILELTKKRHPATKVILITAYGSEEVRKEAKRLGADEYFDKPMDLDLLLKAIEKFGVPIKKKGSTVPVQQV
jgi:DNA-binding NtrC family response regulator